jgi:hypothetical protein
LTKKTIDRLLKIDLPKGQSAFLWGPRKTGKTNGRGQNVSVITVLLVVSHFSGVPNIAGHVRNPYLMNWMDLYE